MKLPPSLEKKRDELAKEKYYGTDDYYPFQVGFNACYELMKAREDLVIEALKEIIKRCEVTGRAYPIAKKAITALEIDGNSEYTSQECSICKCVWTAIEILPCPRCSHTTLQADDEVGE